jgi:hypothetical protein
MTRTRAFPKCFRIAAGHAKRGHAAFDRALHTCLAREAGGRVAYGEVTRSASKVARAASRDWSGGRAARPVSVTVKLHRTTAGKYAATACIRRRGDLPRRGRCAAGMGAGPTSAIKDALRALVGVLH